MKYLRSKVTTSPNKDFGLKAGNLYELCGYPYNTNSGVVLVKDEADAVTTWAESLFEEDIIELPIRQAK